MSLSIAVTPPLLPTSATLLDALEEWASRIAIVICDLDPGQERTVMAATNKLLSAIELEADRGMMARGIEAKDREANACPV